MNMHNCKIILATLISLAITPMAAADIFKCNGPDGPVYTDRECGPDATNVELSDSSGLGGITEETKAVLAEKKASREKARNQVKNTTVINNQYTTINTPPVYWPNRPYWRGKPPVARPPVVVPKPLPSTIAMRRKR